MTAKEQGLDGRVAIRVGMLEKNALAIRKIMAVIARVCAIIALIMVAVLAVVVVVDVVSRDMGFGVPGLSEVGIFLMVTLTFLTLPYVGIRKGHLRIPIVFEKFPPNVQKAMTVSSELLGLIILGLFVWRTAGNAILMQEAHVTTMMLEWPIFPIAYIIPFGLALSAVIVLTDLTSSISTFLKQRWRPGIITIILVPLLFCTIPLWFGWLGVSKEIAGLLAIAVMLTLLLLGLPIAYALVYAGLGPISYLTSWGSMLSSAATVPYSSVANYFLVCLPLFLLMGSLCVFSGISEGLFKTAKVWLGRLPGSLAMATIAGGAMFGAVCGDSIATAAAMGRVSLQPMKNSGYDRGLSGACIAVSGTLGIMIPPSIPMVIYSILTETSVARLFMAGIIPGIVTASAVMTTIYFMVKRNPSLAPLGDRSSFKEKLVSLRGSIAMLVLFLLIMGGIYGGLFTPIEAGAVGTFGALVYALGKRSLSLQNLKNALLDAAEMSGMVLLILVGISFLNSAMSLSEIPFTLADFAASLEVSRWVIFAGLIALYIFAGMVMNIFAAIMITIPILLPLLIAMQFDLIWLGIIIVLLVMIGQVTPPVAIVIYAVKAMEPDLPMGAMFGKVTLLWISEAFVIVLIILIPQIALFLTNI